MKNSMFLLPLAGLLALVGVAVWAPSCTSKPSGASQPIDQSASAPDLTADSPGGGV